MKDIEIIDYQDSFKDALKKLSLEWLLKYELLEPEDERIINNPREVVLNSGGRIFFARHKGDIIGTISLIKIDESTFELAKLAVTERFQGGNIGSRLIERCLMTARTNGAKKIILYTNSKLISAVRLYKKFGFVKVVEVKQSKYLESDMKMELSLQ